MLTGHSVLSAILMIFGALNPEKSWHR